MKPKNSKYLFQDYFSLIFWQQSMAVLLDRDTFSAVLFWSRASIKRAVKYEKKETNFKFSCNFITERTWLFLIQYRCEVHSKYDFDWLKFFSKIYMISDVWLCPYNFTAVAHFVCIDDSHSAQILLSNHLRFRFL